MPTVEMVCLANSKKHQGRCVAGIRSDGGGWIRLISGEKDGTLVPGRHYRMADGTEPRILDSLRIDVIAHRPSPHQPENWLFKSPVWQTGRPLDSKVLIDLLRSHVTHGPTLLGNCSDRISYDSFNTNPGGASLTLVNPGSSLRFKITSDYKGIPRVRVLFNLDEQAYNLGLTDPVWQKQLLQALPDGVCTRKQAGLKDDDDVLLTISLGEPFNDYCYKIVAAVVVVPR